MGKEFLNEVESIKHRMAKEKLYNMLSNGLIVYDQYNYPYNEYGEYYDGIFLHMESPILNFKNSVLYSNKKAKLPCYKYLDFNYTKNKELLCKQKGVYGNVGCLPCRECILTNLKENKLDIGYIPDIAFGYNGKHITWFEINHTHPSTLHKLYFCYKANIKLFEIDSDFVLNLDSSTNKLCIKRFSIKDDDYELTEKITRYVLEAVLDKRLINCEILDIFTERKFKKDKSLQQHFKNIIKEYKIDSSMIKY